MNNQNESNLTISYNKEIKQFNRVLQLLKMRLASLKMWLVLRRYCHQGRQGTAAERVNQGAVEDSLKSERIWAKGEREGIWCTKKH